MFLMPMAGNRNNFDGSVNNEGSNGNYRSSSVNDINAWSFYFYIDYAGMSDNGRVVGKSVRCLKD